MDEANKQALLSAIRSLLIVLGSSLIAHGWVTDTQWTQIVGALTTIAPIAWGVLDKFQAEKNTQARVADAVATATGAHPTLTAADAANDGGKP